MKVAIDIGPTENGDSVRGKGVYTRELLVATGLAGVDVSKTDLSKYNIVQFTRFNPFFISVPFTKPRNIKFILTIYDLIPLIYPKHYPSGIRGWIKWHINKFLIRKNINAIITISETSKKDICRFLRFDPKKVHVIYLASRLIFKKLEISEWKVEVKKQYNLPDRFALYVGDINYNKNIPNLVKACKLAKMPLVIVGKQAAEIENMDLNHLELKHLKNVDWAGVIRVGFVPDADLIKIYNLATVYVQPSLYEGFGLPVLEALACGTPVVATKTQCLVEILGDDFNYVGANDPKDIAKGILNPNKGSKLPRVYTWHQTAKETTELYNTLT
ncbi:MAG: glycosyltransferase family 1 protein [Candidatus Microgenomates bacterium]|jgi:glycosyltransferase involved in cell wall biosynthesis